VGVLRAPVPAVAGAAAMPYRTFLIANVARGAVSAVVVAGLGFSVKVPGSPARHARAVTR